MYKLLHSPHTHTHAPSHRDTVEEASLNYRWICKKSGEATGNDHSGDDAFVFYYFVSNDVKSRWDIFCFLSKL